MLGVVEKVLFGASPTLFYAMRRIILNGGEIYAKRN